MKIIHNFDNKTGIHPYEFNVLLKQSPTPEKTRAGIFIPEETRSRTSLMGKTATVIACAPDAFDQIAFCAPEPGDTVIIETGAGVILEKNCFRDGFDPGEDTYRLVKDKSILAMVSDKITPHVCGVECSVPWDDHEDYSDDSAVVVDPSITRIEITDAQLNDGNGYLSERELVQIKEFGLVTTKISSPGCHAIHSFDRYAVRKWRKTRPAVIKAKAMYAKEKAMNE